MSLTFGSVYKHNAKDHLLCNAESIINTTKLSISLYGSDGGRGLRRFFAKADKPILRQIDSGKLDS